MRKIEMTVGEMALLAGTRALLGLGVGLLLSERLGDTPRRAVGGTLLAVGLLTTLPLALDVVSQARGDSADAEGR